MEHRGQRNDSELIPMVKMERRNPVKGYFRSDFRRSVIMWSYSGLKLQDVNKF